jgi:glycosyltransferase involved in cell wall biosynthesis
VDIALAALARVPDARLSIIGDGPSRRALEALALRFGVGDRADFRGHASDIRPHLASCHAVLSSSRKEALGLSLLEAMASGRPVVAPRIGGIVEFLDDSVGYPYAAPDPDRLAAAMGECMRDAQLADKGMRARERVATRFSLDAMGAAYARVYRELSTMP